MTNWLKVLTLFTSKNDVVALVKIFDDKLKNFNKKVTSKKLLQTKQNMYML